MNKKIYNICALAGVAVAVSMMACSNDDDLHDLTPAYYPSEVGMVLPSEYEQLLYTDETDATVLPLIAGESLTIQHYLRPDSVTFTDVLWSSTSPDIVSVDGSGNIAALAEGYSVIQVSPDPYHSGSGIAATLKVIVSNQINKAVSIDVTADVTDIYAGETTQLTATILPTSTTYRTVKWTSSDTSVATVDSKGLVTGVYTSAGSTPVTITATALDGSGVSGSCVINVIKSVAPESVTIDPRYAYSNGYGGAWNEKTVTLEYTTVPENCTRSFIVWESSDENIATVSDGVVKWNQNGIFGKVTITATCPETGNSSSIDMSLEAGLMRELYHDKDNIMWRADENSSTTNTWSYGSLTVTTYSGNSTQRADFKCQQGPAYIHAGNYPIIAFKIEDVLDKYADQGVTQRNITFDTSGSCNGTNYKGGINGNNNKWLYNYVCSDGSHVWVYDISVQSFATGGLLPTNALASFGTFQLKYADIKTIDAEISYTCYWVQTFKTIEDMEDYLTNVDGVTFTK